MVIMICPKCKKQYNNGRMYCPLCDSEMKPLKGSAILLRIMLSMLLTMLMVIFLAIFTVSSAARVIFNEKNIEKFAENADILSLPAEVSVKQDGHTEIVTVQDEIFLLYEGSSLKSEDIRTIYERSTFPSFIKEQITGYIRYISNEDASYEPPEADRIKALFDENLGVINSVSEKPFTDKDIEETYKNIDEFYAGSGLNERGEGDHILRKELSRLCSAGFAVFTAVLAAVMLLLMFAVNKNSASVLRWGGTAFVFCGISVLIVYAAFPTALVSGIPAFGSAVKCLSEIVSPTVYSTGIAYVVAGAAMHILGGIRSRAYSKNAIQS